MVEHPTGWDHPLGEPRTEKSQSHLLWASNLGVDSVLKKKKKLGIESLFVLMGKQIWGQTKFDIQNFLD